MNKLQAALLLFVILFIGVFLIDYFFIKRKYLKKIKSKKKKVKENDLTEIAYLVGKFNLNKIYNAPVNLQILRIDGCFLCDNW